MAIEHINPASMHSNPGFSQGIAVAAGTKLLFIGGQNAVNARGEVVARAILPPSPDRRSTTC